MLGLREGSAGLARSWGFLTALPERGMASRARPSHEYSGCAVRYLGFGQGHASVSDCLNR